MQTGITLNRSEVEELIKAEVFRLSGVSPGELRVVDYPWPGLSPLVVAKDPSINLDLKQDFGLSEGYVDITTAEDQAAGRKVLQRTN